MPETGIDAHRLAACHKGSPEEGGVYTFFNDVCGSTVSPLIGGESYRSRSIMFMPGYFKSLAEREGSEFGCLFGSFGASWNESASLAIGAALRQIAPSRALLPGARLFLAPAVEGMVAELAASQAADDRAREAEQTRGGGRTAGQGREEERRARWTRGAQSTSTRSRPVSS